MVQIASLLGIPHRVSVRTHCETALRLAFAAGQRSIREPIRELLEIRDPAPTGYDDPHVVGGGVR